MTLFVPKEIVIHILNYSTAATLLRANQVCTYWNELLSIDKSIWRNVVNYQFYSEKDQYITSISTKKDLKKKKNLEIKEKTNETVNDKKIRVKSNVYKMKENIKKNYRTYLALRKKFMDNKSLNNFNIYFKWACTQHYGKLLEDIFKNNEILENLKVEDTQIYERCFLEACKFGLAQIIENLINMGHYYAVVKDTNTFIIALRNKNLHVVELLINNDSNIMEENEVDLPLLFTATKGGFLGLFKKLIKNVEYLGKDVLNEPFNYQILMTKCWCQV